MLGAVLALAALVALAWVPLWWFGATGWRLAFALLPLTPLVGVLALAVAVIAGATGRWWVAAVAGVATVVLAAVVLPRAVPDGPGGAVTPPGAPTPVVATVNLQFGRADPAAVVALVRAHRVTALSLQELTPDAERRLAEAGLFAELPFRVTLARTGAGGTGLVARVPLTAVEIGLRPATFHQVAARADLPGLGPTELVAVHPTAPIARGEGARWVREITDIPAPRPDGTARVVLGDFNATLDHRPLRTLIATGYRDAAAETGSGLVGTWPTDQPPLPRFAAIDHVLLAGAPVATDVVVEPLPGTDHAAVVVSLAAR